MAMARSQSGGIPRKFEFKNSGTSPKKGRKAQSSAAKQQNKVIRANTKKPAKYVSQDTMTKDGRVVRTPKYGSRMKPMAQGIKGGGNSISQRKQSVPAKVRVQGSKTMSQGIKYSAGRKGK